MAELTTMRNNVLGYPIYALPYVLAFPILDEDGDPVTGLTPDSEISKNGDTAVDTATEAAEIAFDTATNKGMYQLQLSAAEMTADVVAITVYTGAATAQATAMVLYPKKLPKIIAGATAGATGNDTTHIHIPDGVAINDFYNGCLVYTLTGTGALQARMISDYVASSRLATVNPAFATAPANDTTYDIYMTEVAVASIIALLTGAIPNAVAGADNGLALKGTVMGKSPATLAAADVSGNLPADVVNWKGSAAPAMTGDAYARLGAAGAGLTALGDTRIANLDAAVSTRAPETAGNLAAVKAKTDNLPVSPAATGDIPSAASIASTVWAYATRTLSSFGTLAADVWSVATRALTDKAGFTISGAKTTLDALQDPTVGAIADQVWDEAIAGHLGAGSTGNALNAAGSAGDPWSTPIPGAYGAGTAGKTVGDNINAPIATVNTIVDAIKVKTDNLPSDPADESLVIAATDSIMTRLGLPAGASLAADLVTIDNLVDDLESRLSAARAGYLDELGAANIPADIDTLIGRLTAARAGYLDNLSAGAVALEAQVQTHAAAALAAFDPPTKAEMDAALAALNDITVAEILAGSLADGVSFSANTLADLIRKVFWMVANKMVVVDATGAYTLYKTDGVTPAATGSIVDDLTNTTRSQPAWP